MGNVNLMLWDINFTTFANISTDALTLRENVVNYLTDKCDSFQNFVTSKSWVEYLRDMAMSNTHGDHITLLAATQLYGVQFLVISSLGAQSTTLISPNGTQTHGNITFKLDPSLPLLSLGHRVRVRICVDFRLIGLRSTITMKYG